MIGQLLLDRYLIVNELERGGLSTTYLARDRFSPQYPLCVVKCVPLDQLDDELALSLRQKIQHEAEILHRLGRVHNQVPWLLAYVESEHQICLVMDYIDGETLDQVQQPSTDAIITLLENVLSVLEFVHACDVIHQDIKPSNLIRRHMDGKIVLIDFGTAYQPNADAQSTVRFGTPGYCPIEQQNGNPVFSSDLYALGVCAIQLLTGIEPTQLRPNATGDMLDWHDYLQNAVDPHLVAILDRLVKIQVRDRYQLATDVLLDLQQLREVARTQQQTPRIVGQTLPFLAYFSNHISNKQSLKALLRLSRSTTLERLLGTAISGIAVVGMISIGIGMPLIPQIRSAISAERNSQGNAQIPSSQVKLQFVQQISLAEGETSNKSQAPTQVVITPDNHVVVGTREGQIQIRSLQDNRMIRSWNAHPGSISKLLLSRDGTLILSSGVNTATIWELATGRALKSIRQPMLKDKALSIDRRFAADSLNQLLEAQNLPPSQLEGSSPPTSDIPIIVDPEAGISVHCSSDYRLKIWNLETKALQQVLAGHTQPVQTAQVSPDRRWLYSTDTDRTFIWNLETAELASVLPGQATTIAQFSEDRLLIANHLGEIQIWNARSGELMQTVTKLDGTVQVSADARYVVQSNSDQSLKIWQLSI